MPDSFFRPAPPRASPRPPPAPVSRPQERGARHVIEPRPPDPEPEVTDDTPVHHRAQGVGATAEVPDHVPRGVLFRVSLPAANGFFDLDGYWCVKLDTHRVVVRRGAPRFVMRSLTDRQKKELARVRLRARREDIR